MSMAIRFHEFGGPEVLRYEAVEVGEPGPGEVRIRQRAIGVNFVDIYQRNGLYQVALPAIAGNEAAGEVSAVGAGVTSLKVGDRVAYVGKVGAYCEERLMPADRLVQLPEAIGFDQAAAMLLKGLTVQYLIRQSYRVEPGDIVLFHAAAGGVGLIACQWLKSLGARVIGTAGSDEKCALAIRHGAEYCINYRTENIVERVKELTGGAGVPVVYDSVGKETFDASLRCLRPYGLLVSFGNASGPVPPLDLSILAQLGSLYVTRPTLNTYTAKRADLESMAAELFQVVTSGMVKIDINHRYPLKDAAQAHRDLEARRTTGSTVLIPE
ncbi:quinone oxidoreductase [Geomonas limicola]|uniref:Quinone oxidoreductase n=1 Tax=Geomonas limicola TaxID=2740186 RepID=A0A6V8NAN3_9BACT|nr:quinone oxidoreductase [Geomonas limicola]GFO69571.1 quinone oxidoreductase [Geomonas limicola]